MTQDWDTWSRLGGHATNDGKIERDPIKFALGTLGDGIFKLGPFWFLLFLFLLMVFNYPLIKWASRRRSMEAIDKSDYLIIVGQLLTFGGWDVFCRLLNDNDTEYWAYLLPANLILYSAYCVLFLIHFLLQYHSDIISVTGYNGLSGIYLIGPMFAMLTVFFVPGSVEVTQLGLLTSFGLHSMFFAKGLLIHTWADVIHSDVNRVKETSLYVFLVVASYAVHGCLVPGNHSELGSVYMFPIYMTRYLNAQFLLGAWFSTYLVLWLFKTELNKPFDPKVFKFVSDSSLWCYISHVLMQGIVVAVLVVPLKDTLNYGIAVIVTFTLSEIMCLASYYGLTKLCTRRRA